MKYTRGSLQDLLVDLQATAQRVGIPADETRTWEVRDLGGKHLYLARMTDVGYKVLCGLGGTPHRAGERLYGLLEAWRVLELEMERTRKTAP